MIKFVRSIFYMKLIFSISFNILLLLVFTSAPITSTWACGGKDKCAKETKEHTAKCQKECCKKLKSSSKKSKKNCCGDNCECAIPVITTADIPVQLSLEMSSNFVPVFVEKRRFLYKRVVVQSSIQDIWQPPITVLSV